MIAMRSLIEFKNVRPMSDDESRAFVQCVMAEKKEIPAPSDLLESFGYQVIRKRLDIGEIPVSDWAIAFLTLLCDTPGKLVMYAYACVEVYRNIRRKVTLEDTAEVFPMGFPKDEALNECWDSQKVEDGNLLDKREPWLP